MTDSDTTGTLPEGWEEFAPGYVRKKRITKQFPNHKPEPLPQAAADVAELRVAHLEPLLFRTPLVEILVSAYMQGVADTYGAMKRDADSGE